VIAVRADARRLPFKDSSFDSASSLFVIHMLDDPSLAIQEIHRVLKDKGRAVLTVMTDNNAIDKILSRWWGLSLRSYDYYLGVLTRYFEVDKARKMGAWSYFEVVKS
jgi:Methylase involved in ubiquinone/menaquinone biosynthesis